MEQLTLVEHPPQQTVEVPRPAVAPRKVALPDRIALRLGLALIVWSRRRNSNQPDREQHRIRHAHHVATERRERRVERSVLLTVPHR